MTMEKVFLINTITIIFAVEMATRVASLIKTPKIKFL